MKPRLGVAKRPRFGKTVARLPLSTPNHVARVAKYWSMAVVGIQRPVLVSSGPLTVSVGNCAVGALAVDRAAEDQVMAAPAVVAALAVARKCAAKIAGGESGDLFRKTELFHRALEGDHALAQFGEQVGVRADGDVAPVCRGWSGRCAGRSRRPGRRKSGASCRSRRWRRRVCRLRSAARPSCNCGLKVELKAVPPSGGVIVVGKGSMSSNWRPPVLAMAVFSRLPVLMVCSATPA